MVSGPSKPKGNTPWRDDGQSIFGRDAPKTSWQMQDIGIAGQESDERCHDDDYGEDDDVRVTLRTLRQGRRSAPVVISSEARAIAEETWRANRVQHQAALTASREEHVVPQSVPLPATIAPACDDFSEDVDPRFVTAVNAALTGRLRNDPNYQRFMNAGFVRDDLRQYVTWHKGDLVEALWIEQGSEEGGVPSLSSRMIVAALMSSTRQLDRVHGLRLLDASKEGALGGSHAQWTFEYSPTQKKRLLTHAGGPWAWEIALAWLETQGETPRDALEKDYLASVWGTRIRAAGVEREEKGQLAEVVLWGTVVGRIGAEGSAFFGRLIGLPHQDYDTTDKLFTVDKKKYNGQERAYGINVLDESKMAGASKSSAKLRLRWAAHGNEWVVGEAKGENINDLIYPWIESRGINYDPVVIRSLIAGMLSMRVLLRPGEEVLKDDLRHELFRPGGLQNILETRAKMDPDFDPNALFVNIVIGFRGSEYYGLQVLSDPETETKSLPKTAAKIRFERQEGGGHRVVKAEGLGHQSFLGGNVFAPDATQMDEAAEQAVAWGKENFGNIEICKPEPLITPAEPMPVPQLERPADAVELPKEGGFQATDPEVAKKFQTPPSDTIPVATRPREDVSPIAMPEVTQHRALLLLDILAAGVLFYFTRGALPSQPALGAGGLFLTPKNRWEAEGT